MAETNGRLKIHPALAWTIAVYLLSLGTGMGVMIARIEGLRRDITMLQSHIVTNTRTRQEGDEIIKRIDMQISGLDSRIFLLEKKAAE